MRSLRWLVMVSVVLVPALAAGCSETPPSITGTLLMDGKPLAGAEVVIEAPADQASLGGAMVRTDEGGRFKIEPVGGKMPLKPGKFFVFVSKWVDRKSGQVPSEEDYDQLKAANVLRNLVPMRYSSREASDPATVDVVAGDNDLKIEVKSR